MKKSSTLKKCFLVIADWNNAESNYKKFKKAIAAYESSVQVAKNCWSVVSEKNPEDIWKDLSSALFWNDRVKGIQTTRKAVCYNVICTNDWLQYDLGEGGESSDK